MFKFKEYCAIFGGYLGAEARKMRSLMNIAVYIGKEELREDARVSALLNALECGGCDTCLVTAVTQVPEITDMLLSVGGDGTFESVFTLYGGAGQFVAVEGNGDDLCTVLFFQFRVKLVGIDEQLAIFF